MNSIRSIAGLRNWPGVRESDAVLDLGCGLGRTLPALLGAARRVVGLDVKPDFLAKAVRASTEALANGKLGLVCADAGMTLPFADESFDVVINQNVAECFVKPALLVEECHRVLRTGGTLLIGHHDYDGVVINSRHRDLTRRLVHAFADHAQNWMERSDGQMGRKHPGLVRSSAFTSAETETMLFVDLGFTTGSYAEAYFDWVTAAGDKLGIDEGEVSDWLADLRDLDRWGGFYFSIPWVYVRAAK